jgi:hypothetical protein
VSGGSMDHMGQLECVTRNDLALLRHKEATYRGSWKRRGGVGAMMMLARKWDRLEAMVQDHGWDIFAAIGTDLMGADGTTLAEIRDLRTYLILVEAEMRARAQAQTSGNLSVEDNRPGTPEDGGHHAQACTDDQLDDGVPDDPRLPMGPEWIAVRCGAQVKWIVDRRVVPGDRWESLPRLSIEQNYQEHKELPDYYRQLYVWDEPSNKWVMLREYQEHWGRQA